jgi:transposase
MDTNPLFTMALGLAEPWQVTETTFAPEGQRLDLRIAYRDSAHFPCPCCSAKDCPVHDCIEKRWRHLDFFQHQAYLTARIPRIRCPTCGVKMVGVPWARPGSGFTLLMEALILEMARHMPVRALARILRVRDKRVWRVVTHYVMEALRRLDLSELRSLALDETSARKRHDYISLFFDLDARRMIFATAGRDAAVLKHFVGSLRAHGGDPKNVRQVSCDMSPAFIKGTSLHLANAAITFDRFHVMKIITSAVDAVRRTEWRKDKTVKGSRYALLKNPENLTPDQEIALAEIINRNAALAKAYRLKETFRDLYRQPDRQAARGFLKAWVIAAHRSGLKPIQQAAEAIKRHWFGILRWHVSKLSNGIMEGLASLIQAAKRKARGYRNHDTFICMAYLIAGKLDLRTHTK